MTRVNNKLKIACAQIFHFGFLGMVKFAVKFA